MKEGKRNLRQRTLPRWLWAILLVLFPAVVGLHIWRTLDMLESQRSLYLRGRVAALAAHVEALPPSSGAERDDWADALFEEEPGLVDARLFRKDGADAVATNIFEGRELYRMEDATVDGEAVLRTWFPVHRGGELQVVRLDFAASSADFLNRYATQSIALVTLIAAALLALSAYTIHLAGRAAQLERRQAEREHLTRLGEMSAVLAHEIRNPLGSIKGFGQLLQEDASDQQREFAGEIVEQSERLERLVNDLLRFGRVPEPRRQPLPWNRLAERLEQSWREENHKREANSLGVTLAIASADVELYTDAALLEQAIANLIRNAREALLGRHEVTGEAGKVSVTATNSRSGSRIVVEDNGPGLSEEARARLFEPFFTTKAFGTGLGLATTQKLVAALGGELRLEAAVTGGLAATIWLPFVSEGKK